jgi:hypothetical protein
MRKVTLALLVLALSVPAMAAVNITMSHPATGANYNQVTIAYSCDASEEVRAFALAISVTDGGFLVGSDEPAGDPNHSDYYVYPGSIQFEVVDGNTVIADFGNPIAEQDANGGVIEMASLYAAADPCHPNPPLASGNLCKFRVISSNCGPDNAVSVSLALDSKRGGVVLKDPNVVPNVILPAAPLTFDTCCWLCPSQSVGNCNTDSSVNVLDYFLFKKAYGTNSTNTHGTGQGQFNCCCDFNHDNKVNVLDYFVFKKYYGTTSLPTCSNIHCP